MTDPYRILGISENASDEEIKKAYRELVKKYHPDLHPNDKAAAEKMSEINAAYDLLKSGKYSAGRTAEYYRSDTDDSGNFKDFTEFDGSGLDIADMFIKSGDILRAKEILSEISVRNARWFFLCSMIELRSGNIGRALNLMESAAALEPDNHLYRDLKEEMENTSESFYETYYRDRPNEQRRMAFSIVFRIIAVILVIQTLFLIFLSAGLIR